MTLIARSQKSAGGHTPRRRILRAVLITLVLAVPVLFLVAFFVYPVTAIIARGVFPDGVLDLGGLVEVLTRQRTIQVISNTLLQATLGTVIAIVLGVPTAFVLYRRTFPGRRMLRTLILIPFVLPAVVVGVAFRSLLASGGLLGALEWDRTLIAIIAALVFFNVGLVVRMVGTVWESLDPRAEQAARTLGASPFRAAITVTLPALLPAIGAAAAIVFLFCATAFGVVLVLGGSQFATIEVEIWLQTTQFLDLQTAAVLSTLQFLVVIVVLWVTALMRPRHAGALALVDTTRTATPLRLWRKGSSLDRVGAVVAVFTIGMILLPLVSMLIRSFQKDGRWTLQNYLALGASDNRALNLSVWDAGMNSLRIALDATVIAVVIGLLLAFALSRRPRSATARRGSAALGAVIMLPLGISAVTVGFGFLIALDRPPLDLRSSLLLIPIAQALVAIPLVVRAVLPILRGINPRLRQAAATLGASPARVLWSVDGPLVLRSLGLAAGLAFAISLGEFGATSFLARPDRATLPVVIYRLLARPGDGNYEMALAASVILALAAGTIMALAERLQARTPGGTRV